MEESERSREKQWKRTQNIDLAEPWGRELRTKWKWILGRIDEKLNEFSQALIKNIE